MKSSRFLLSRFVLFTGLILVPASFLSLNPTPLVAQEASSPAAQPAHPEKPEAQGEAKKKESGGEESTAAFRHSAMVQKLANLLHLQLETAAKLFEYINFGIVVLAVVIPLVRYMPKVFRRRTEDVQRRLNEARTATEDANTRLGAVEERLTRIDEAIATIRQQVEQESVRDQQRIKESLEEESRRIVDSASQEIDAASAAAQRDLRKFAAELAVEKAIGRLAITPETDRALVSGFARDLTKGGQN